RGSRPDERRSAGQGRIRGAARRSNHPTPDLVLLDRFEQGTEVAFAEALVALALDDLEEDRADDVLREDLQQHALALLRVAVDQDAPRTQLRERFAMPGHARRDTLVIG